LKTISLHTKAKITAPGFDLAGHAKLRACLDISQSEIILSLFTPENEWVYLQHVVLKANERTADALEYLVETEPFFSLDYAGVYICMSNTLYTLVPGALFVNENKEDVLKFNHSIPGDMLVLSDEIVSADSHCVYAFDKRTKELLDKAFPNNHVKHKTSCLIEGMSSVVSKTHKTCLVHVQGNTMDVTLYNKKLLFFNTFTFQTAEDFLYFVLAALEQNSCTPDETEIILAGEIEAGSAIFTTLKQYLPKIKFAIANRSIVKKNDFIKLPEHFYYTTFNLYLCAL
jgi:hypothetical protein